MVRVLLPYHLRVLAQQEAEIQLELPAPVSMTDVLVAMEARFPALRGTMRDPITLRRRPYVRFFACGEDISLDDPTRALPDPIALDQEPLWIVGALAGG